jgi:hypothetical protein
MRRAELRWKMDEVYLLMLTIVTWVDTNENYTCISELTQKRLD